MPRWIDRLRAVEKNSDGRPIATDKTDRNHSRKVLSVLSAPSGRSFGKFSLEDGDWREVVLLEFEERAAILEFDEGLSRREAEALARRQVRAANDHQACGRSSDCNTGSIQGGGPVIGKV